MAGGKPGRPRKMRPFTEEAFVQMITSQIRPMVIKELVNEFNRYEPNAPARTRMAEAIEEGMYGRYTPTMYERRRENKGLLSRSNMLIYYTFTKSASNSTQATKEYAFKIRMANIAKPEKLTASNWYYNAVSGTAMSAPQSEIKDTKIEDALYYWKDQGLVYNLFHDPNFYQWGAPTHFNDILFRKYFDNGVLQKMFGWKFNRKLGTLKMKVK